MLFSFLSCFGNDNVSDRTVKHKKTGRSLLLRSLPVCIGSSTLVQSFKKVKNFKSPLFIDDLKFFCCQVLKVYVACVAFVAPLLYNILEVFDHETLV